MNKALEERLEVGFNVNFEQKGDLRFFRAPGRTEIGGNHTDHQHGCVLAAAVDLAVTACVQKNDDNVIRIKSEGFPADTIDLSDLSVHDDEANKAAALIRGIAAKMKKDGHVLGGFDAYTVSNVLKGSGLSSSAAFEDLVGTVINYLYNDGALDAVEIAQDSQYAENVYFKKPCGLMDQLACSYGGLIGVDFQTPEHPVIRQIPFDIEKAGYKLCIIDSGADHADLTDEYAAVPAEMKKIAAHFDADVLRDVKESDFMSALPALRSECGDRAVLRAMHFYDEQDRVKAQSQALINNDTEKFLSLVSESGRSSFMYLQNVIPSGSIEHQDVAFVLGMCRQLLSDRGAFRVHGGGFAGTVQAYVPADEAELFIAEMNKVLGEDAAVILGISAQGAGEINSPVK
jgi:galactokinase